MEEIDYDPFSYTDMSKYNNNQGSNNDDVGSVYIITLGNYQKWLVFYSIPNSLHWDKNLLYTNSPIIGKSILRVAILPLQDWISSYQSLLPYLYRYPISANVSFNYNTSLSTSTNNKTQSKIIDRNDKSSRYKSNSSRSSEKIPYVTVEISYESSGRGPLLMLALPHQYDIMIEPRLSSSSSSSSSSPSNNIHIINKYSPIWCIKGKMRAVVGDSWTLRYELLDVPWDYEDSYQTYYKYYSDVRKEDRSNRHNTNSYLSNNYNNNSNNDPEKGNNNRSNSKDKQIQVIIKSLHHDINIIIPSATSDTYNYGKEISRMARLAMIAYSLNELNYSILALNHMKQSLSLWLTNQNSDPFIYDDTYGGIITSNSLNDTQSNYGLGMYNDHHFHYGYFIYAAAIIMKLDNDITSRSIYSSNSNSNRTNDRFFDQHGFKDLIDGLVLDICNHDSNNEYFPLAR